MANGSFRGDAGLRVEVQRKAQRVDTGIGAAAPLDIGRLWSTASSPF